MATQDDKIAQRPAADPRKECPKCRGIAPLTVPLKKVPKEIALYSCPACGHAFSESGAAFIDSAEKLRDVFRAVSAGDKALDEALEGMNLKPAARALLLVLVTEYGLQMWFDGYKTGMLYGAKQAEVADGDEQVQHGQSVPSRESEERRNRINDALRKVRNFSREDSGGSGGKQSDAKP